MKSIDKYTKEELYVEFVAQSTKVECLTKEIEWLHSVIMKLGEKSSGYSSSKVDVRTGG